MGRGNLGDLLVRIMDLWDYHLKYSKEWKCNLPIARACTRNNCTKCPYGEKREVV